MKGAFDQKRGLALGLVLLAVSGASLGLWWKAVRRPEINFLPGMAAAEWILYPTPPNVDLQRDLELRSRFRTGFDLDKVPPQAVLRIAGFRRYELSINGSPVQGPRQAGRNWKQPDVYEVAGRLRAGQNRIEVGVYNSNGPPALWLRLDAGALKVSSGEDWQVSYAGAAWRAAGAATRPKWVPAGNRAYGGEDAWTGLRSRWPVLLIFVLLSGIGCWALEKKTGTQNPGSEAQSPTSKVQSSTGQNATQGSQPETRNSKPETRILGLGIRAWLPFLVVAGFWVALFANNLGTLPDLAGYDVKDHLAYIRYIQEKGSLPLANQGWEMFQPPLYYLVSAGLLNLLSLSVSDSGGILALRLLGLFCGVAHCAVAWAALRLLFPGDAARRRWGLMLAGCVPPMLYLSQYITNEGLAAALATACLYLCLIVLKQNLGSWRTCAGLGLCLGIALLAKTTNVLLVPVVLGALIWRRLERAEGSLPRWAGSVALVCAVAALVCGWHYGRVWMHFGNPLIGNWDPKTGFAWWQDDGYRTSAYYLRFGAALKHPWYAGFKSFGDGVYSTLWGDGLLGGAVRFSSRLPWNYELMAIGYWLSLLPALAVLAGALLTLIRFIRQPSAEGFLLLGLSFLIGVALIYMTLVVPSGGQAKAFYGLCALLPLCAFGALGLGALAGRHRCRRWVVGVLLGVWALNSYATFWVVRSSLPYALNRGEALAKANRFADAVGFLKERLKSEPRSVELRLLLVFALFPTGDLDEAERQVQSALRLDPGNGEAWVWQAAILRQRGQLDRAIDAARRSVELAPGNGAAYGQLNALLMQQKRYGDAIQVARQGLGIEPFSSELRLALASALLLDDQADEAATQFRYAYVLNPSSADRMNRLAWKLATAEDAGERNGAMAVKLAGQICSLTRNRKAVYLVTLAAAAAETGQYQQAVQTAERAETTALESGQAGLAGKIRQLIDLFKSGQPYRETASQWN